MKKLHLLCNAHLDPVWLWQRNEGVAAALSTFRCAADFCEKYDGFIFNHNEALLYEWVEEHEPELFARIQKLVKEKKWVIMGGWYLQPDCVMTSGESLMAQIRLGREYFLEKFGVVPATAINFDPFGHSRGLVQILKNAGYTGYLFQRPQRFAKGDFLWEGFDGSQIHAHGILGVYATLLGTAAKEIQDEMKILDEHNVETGLILWGVGNHGGGPSRKDIEDIAELMKESDVEIIHSSADAYMAQVDQSKLPVVKESLIPFAVGCYTSMVRIKQANRRLENKLSVAEKAMSYAGCFDKEELNKARKALAFCQFHDVLPGSGIKDVEEDSLRTFGYGEDIADRLYDRAFFKLCAGQPAAKPGETPILVFNPHPYEIETVIEVEFTLQNQNWNEGEFTFAEVYDEAGNRLPAQNEKPRCTFNLDWVKKVSFCAKLAPAGVSRFNCKLAVRQAPIFAEFDQSQPIEIKNERMTVKISRKTGLIELFETQGKTYVCDSGVLEVYRDKEDPWAMFDEGFKEKLGEFTLMSDADANRFAGYPEEDMHNVRIVEDGEARTKVQAFFSYGPSVAVVEYTIPKQGDWLDVDITMHSMEASRMIKYRIDSQVSGEPWGETAFGCQKLYDNENEDVYHKWCGIRSQEGNLYVLNRGTYGGSFNHNTMKLSLLRTPTYSTHPIIIGDRKLAPSNRFNDHIDIGERKFSYRIMARDDVDRQAQIFNEAPRALSFFPSGAGESRGPAVTLDAPEVILSSVRQEEMVLHNTADHAVTANLERDGKKLQVELKPFEVKVL